MKVSTRITHIEYIVNSHMNINGYLWPSSHRHRSFTKSEWSTVWTWIRMGDKDKDELIPELIKLGQAVDSYLMSAGIIPKKWPSALLHDDHDEHISYNITSIKLTNPDWESSITNNSTRIVSNIPNFGEVTKDFKLELDKEVIVDLFTALDHKL